MNFQQLVLQHKGSRSYQDISKAAGGVPDPKGLQRLVTDGFTRLPSPATLTGVAKALDISTHEILIAAARTIGLEVDDVSSAEVIPHESKEDKKGVVTTDTLGGTQLLRPGTPDPEEQIYYWRKHAEHYKARALAVTTGVTGHQGGHAHARR
jgi:hypothetical protein